MSSAMTKFESLLEAAPDAMVGVDQGGVIRFVNRQTEVLFGYERDDLVAAMVASSRWTSACPPSRPRTAS